MPLEGSPKAYPALKPMKLKNLLVLVLMIVCTQIETKAIYDYDGFYYEQDGTKYSCYALSETTVKAWIVSSTKSHVSVPSQIYDHRSKTNCTLVSFLGMASEINSVTSISLPSSVQTLERAAFRDCKTLTSVSMPNIQLIDEMTFENCTSLTSVSMPKAQTIGYRAFHGCISLTSVSMPNVRLLVDDAFQECYSLISVTMPKAETIGVSAFYFCTALTSISMPNVQTIDRSAFGSCHSLVSVVMPNVRTIGESAFRDCSSLTSVTLPNLRTLEPDAFYYCNPNCCIYIDQILPPQATYKDGTPADICDYWMYKTARLIVPEGAVEAYRNTFPWSNFFIAEKMNVEAYEDFNNKYGMSGFPVQRITQSDYNLSNSSIRGLTADGLTKLWINVKNFDLDGTNATITARINGKIINDPNLIGSIGNLTKKTNSYGFVLTAPEGYYGPENSSSYTIDYEISTADKNNSYYARVEIWRPGVILLHGLNSSSDCWSQAYDYLLESGAYSSAQIVNASYKSSNKVSFDDNTHKYNVVEHNMKNLYAQLYAVGIASTRYDLVGHSMGGILSRKYAQEVDARTVNRILTFDTPHSGSSLGLLPDKLNINLLDVLLGNAGAKLLINAILTRGMAVHDLNPSSEATAKLNSPELIANAVGIPSHAVCNVFDGIDHNVTPDIPGLLNTTHYLPINIALPLWLSRLGSKVILGSQAAFDFLSLVLGEEQHDGVVNFASQRGGLTAGTTASVFNAQYKGEFGFESPAHHCNMTNWSENHHRLLSLLQAPKDDVCFANSFAPVDLSKHSTAVKIRKLRANKAPEDAFISLTAEQKGYIVNLHVVASEHVMAKGIMCVLDEDRVIFADGDTDGNAVVNIPEDVEGELEFVAVGLCDNDGWIVDVERLTFDGTAQPAWLKIENPDPMIIAVGQCDVPQVIAHWYDDYSTPVNASLELIDADGIAEITDGAVCGLSEGECRLAISYRNLNDTIDVNVVGGLSGIKPTLAEVQGDMRFFTRGGMLVARFQNEYDGNIDLELYRTDGVLVARTSSGGMFEPGDEFTMPLPSASGQLYIARCRKRDGGTSMKIIR